MGNIKTFLGTRAYFAETLDRGDLPQFHDGELVDPAQTYMVECVDGVLEYSPQKPADPVG
jgi:hypothetical protein